MIPAKDKGWLLALLIAVLGVALRIGPVGEFWLNGDEGIYDRVAHAPAGLARAMISRNAHPPLYYWLLRGIAFVTEDFVWLRLPALISGCGSVLAIYALGREVKAAESPRLS